MTAEFQTKRRWLKSVLATSAQQQDLRMKPLARLRASVPSSEASADVTAAPVAKAKAAR
jgi:hypothetical protein